MRKIYSLVLMTAMLFVGANAWAVNVAVSGSTGTRAELQTAIDGVTGTDPVTLTLQHDFVLNASDKPLWIGTETFAGTPKSIILDLNGHSITKGSSTNTTDCTLFILSHGELKVTNSAWSASNPTANVSEIKVMRQVTGDNDNSTIFMVYGSYRSSRWNDTGNDKNNDSINTRVRGDFSHLLIDRGVKLVGDCAGTAIVVDAFSSLKVYNKDNQEISLKYHTMLHNANLTLGSKTKQSRGYAYGVRVDVEGSIEMMPVGTKKRSYGIKTNGNLHAATLGNVISVTQMGNPLTNINYLENYNSNINGHKLDTIDAPFVYVHSTASIKTDNTSTRSAAVYASGYAKWQLAGHCEGNIGASVSSGEVAITGGQVTSTAQTYTPATGDGGVTGSGSAIVVNSRDGYAGNTNVTISGDPEITATSGFAIEEKVTTSDSESKTESVVINGGTIDGGEQGAIAVTTTVPDPEDPTKDVPVTTVYSGNISGDVSGSAATSLEDLLPTGEGAIEVHTTVVYDENGENPVTVISPGKGNTGWSATVASAGKDSIKWTGASETIYADLTIAELEINKMDSDFSPAVPEAQTLTIGTNTTNVVVTVGKVILGPRAKIIVNPGSKLIITGSQGIYSTVNDNLELKANADAQATFVIGPNVTNNKQPRATVQFYTKCYKAGTNSWVWQRFAAPLVETTTVTHDQEGSIGTGVKYIDESTSSWVSIGAWSDLTPFTACAISNNLSEGTHATYTFPGKLVGNTVDLIKRKPATWNYYGNSFMAPISTLALLNVLSASQMSSVIYYWDTNIAKQGYNYVNLEMLVGEWAGEGIVEIPAMGFFVLRNNTAEEGDLNIDYNNSIFRYAQGLAPEYPTPAPMRSASANSTKMRICMQDENGAMDVVYMLANANHSMDFEDGSDVEKLMNEGMNLYVLADVNYSMLYTNELMNTMLGVQTGEGVNYTLTFTKVQGEPYALRDNQTGRVIAINEGTTYTFAAQPNETIEGRFEIVGRHEMPTAVETVEETAAPKAIYTVMGQYVGETTDWNNLPAGVYVVDGVKIVK